jgi:hypothetical protein
MVMAQLQSSAGACRMNEFAADLDGEAARPDVHNFSAAIAHDFVIFSASLASACPLVAITTPSRTEWISQRPHYFDIG